MDADQREATQAPSSALSAVQALARQALAKLHPELTFLGVGLVGLYLTLEQLQVPLNPREAFEASAPLHGG